MDVYPCDRGPQTTPVAVWAMHQRPTAPAACRRRSGRRTVKAMGASPADARGAHDADRRGRPPRSARPGRRLRRDSSRRGHRRRRAGPGRVPPLSVSLPLPPKMRSRRRSTVHDGRCPGPAQMTSSPPSPKMRSEPPLATMTSVLVVPQHRLGLGCPDDGRLLAVAPRLGRHRGAADAGDGEQGDDEREGDDASQWQSLRCV